MPLVVKANDPSIPAAVLTENSLVVAADPVTGDIETTTPKDLLRLASKSIAATVTVPFASLFTSIAPRSISGALVFTKDTTDAVPGFGAIHRLTANGVNEPDLSAFKKVGSGSWVNTNGQVNVLMFLFDGTDYLISIYQPVAISAPSGGGGNVTPVAPVAVADDNADTLSFTHALGTGEIEVSIDNSAYAAYAGPYAVGNVARAEGYYKARTKAAAGRNVSAATSSPAFTVAGGGGASVSDPMAISAISRKNAASGLTLSNTWQNALDDLIIAGKAGANWVQYFSSLQIANGSNLAGSLINIISDAEHLAAGALVPSYNAANGWNFAGGDNAVQHLLTGLIPATHFGPNWSIVFGTLTDLSLNTSPTQYTFGAYIGENSAIDFACGINATEGRAHAYNAQLFNKPANGAGNWHIGFGGGYPSGGLAIFKETTLLYNLGTGGGAPTNAMAIGGRNVDGSGVIQGAPQNMWYWGICKTDELPQAAWNQFVTDINAFKAATNVV